MNHMAWTVQGNKNNFGEMKEEDEGGGEQISIGYRLIDLHSMAGANFIGTEEPTFKMIKMKNY